MRRGSARRARRGIVGPTSGLQRRLPLDRIGDYVTGLKRLWGLADYFTVNVSSPNTPGLRDLQGGEALQDLLGRLAEARVERCRRQRAGRPIFLKLAL